MGDEELEVGDEDEDEDEDEPVLPVVPVVPEFDVVPDEELPLLVTAVVAEVVEVVVARPAEAPG